MGSSSDYNTVKAKIKYSFILPCRNERFAIKRCINEIRSVMHNSSYEIIVSDSSTDGSARIAKELGARVIHHGKPGYGLAIQEGIKAASGEVLIIADCDQTYDFRESLRLIGQSKVGTLVIGKRKQIQSGAMPFFHRYVGTPLLSGFLSLLFHQRITDNNSGFRVLYKSDYDSLGLRTTGMEFASEMLVKSLLRRFKIVEVPISYRRRVGASKLSTLSDGWRHLRFLLAYVPLNIFFVLGTFLFAAGTLGLLFSIGGSLSLPNLTLYRSVSFISSFLCYVGFTILQSSIVAKIVLKQRGLGSEEKLLTAFAKVPFEIAVSICVFFFLGFSVALSIITYNWWVHHIVLNTNLLVFLLTGTTLAFQSVISAFLVSFLLVETK